MSYGFPVLEVDEIVAFLRDSAIPVDTSDFTKPEAIKWREIYTYFVEHLTGVQFDSNVPVLIPETCDHPELYTEAHQEMWFVMVVQRVLRSAGFGDFCLRDVRSPSKPRLTKICSAVINYMKFISTRLDVYRNLKEEHERSREHYEHFLRRNEEIKAKVDRLKEEKHKQEPELAKINQDVEVITQKMEEHVKTKATIEKSIEELKTNIAEKAASVEQTKHAICKSREEMEKLSLMIVQSPEKLKKEQERMKHQISQLKEVNEQKRQKTDDMRVRLDKLRQHKNNVDAALKMIGTIQEDIDKENEISKEVTKLKDRTAEQREAMRSLQAKHNQQKHVESTKYERLSKLTLQHQSKMKSAQDTIQRLETELSKLKMTQTQEEAKKRDLSEQKQKLYQHLEERLRKEEEKIQERKNTYSEVLQLVDQNHSQLAEKFGDLKEAMQ